MNALDKAISKLETVANNIAGGNLNVTELRSPREQMLAKARRLKIMLENNTLARELIEDELGKHMARYQIREEELAR